MPEPALVSYRTAPGFRCSAPGGHREYAAGQSPLIEEIAVHDKSQFDLGCEVYLFGAQLSAQLRQPASTR
jgi:hypothetical protein